MAGEEARRRDGVTFVCEMPAGSTLVSYGGRVVVVHPDHPVRVVTAAGLVDLFPVFPGEW